MRVLVACEFSGIVRDAFAARGHDAWSCDLLECERPGQHIQWDVLEVLAGPGEWSRWPNRTLGRQTPEKWDLMIAHPPCTYLAVSGARWWKGRECEQESALAFVRALLEAPIPRIALENPIGAISTRIRKPEQIVQPWMFGHGETKATCLWLKGLPLLVPTNVVGGRKGRVHHEPPSPDRWKNRSRTYQGIADAFAEQWSAQTNADEEGRDADRG